jgi:predicted Rdx family selenoprotein
VHGWWPAGPQPCGRSWPMSVSSHVMWTVREVAYAASAVAAATALASACRVFGGGSSSGSGGGCARTTSSGSSGPAAAVAHAAAGVEIEYCVGCRWMMRAAWTAQELLTTFASDKDEHARLLGGVRLVPSRGAGGGVFQVRLVLAGGTATEGAVAGVINGDAAPATKPPIILW